MMMLLNNKHANGQILFVGEDKVTPKIIVQCGAYYAILFKEREGRLLQTITKAAKKGHSKMLVRTVIVCLYVLHSTAAN